MNEQSIIQGLQAIVGGSGVIQEQFDMQAYLVDWRKRHHGQALCVVFPASTQQVSAVVRFCAEHDLRIFPQGGNTSVCGGSVPTEDGRNVVLNLARMNTITSVNAADNSMTVEAGCILANIHDAAAAEDKLFPLSFGAEGSCQIGGCIATNAGGVNVIRYGNTRDLILGLEVVLPDGTLWNGLRTLRKNNSGYDLKHLFIGSEGTLGIVTGATLKLYPQPKAMVTAMLAVPDIHAAVDQGLRLQQAFSGSLTALEFISGSEYEIVLKHSPTVKRPLASSPQCVVLIELSAATGTSEMLVDVLSECLEPSIEAGVIEDAVIASSEQQRQDLWLLRHSVTESNVHEGMGITHDIAVPIYRIPDFVDQAGAALAEHYPEARPVIVGHMGDGNLHYIAMFPHAVWAEVADKKAFQHALSCRLYDIAAALDGTFSAEHGIGSLHVDEMGLYKPQAELNLMQSIKALLDPANRFNPGRVLPGTNSSL